MSFVYRDEALDDLTLISFTYLREINKVNASFKSKKLVYSAVKSQFLKLRSKFLLFETHKITNASIGRNIGANTEVVFKRNENAYILLHGFLV
jgi:hypothetical protein